MVCTVGTMMVRWLCLSKGGHKGSPISPSSTSCGILWEFLFCDTLLKRIRFELQARPTWSRHHSMGSWIFLTLRVLACGRRSFCWLLPLLQFARLRHISLGGPLEYSFCVYQPTLVHLQCTYLVREDHGEIQECDFTSKEFEPSVLPPPQILAQHASSSLPFLASAKHMSMVSMPMS